MNKILLIIAREYLTRVKKKTFLLMTFLTPLLIAGIYSLIIFFAIKPGEIKTIEVLDESRFLINKLEDTKTLKFTEVSGSLESVKAAYKKSNNDGLLYIPEISLQNPDGIKYFANKSISLNIISDIEKVLKDEIENQKLLELGINKEAIENTKTNVSISAISLTESGEKDSNAGLATGLGFMIGFMMYLFIFIYGVQVMRGVIEEKTTRIIEVIISSVKPFQLMLGKIFGIAAVGLTQFLLWIILTTTISAGASAIFADKINVKDANLENMMDNKELGSMQGGKMVKVVQMLNSVDVPYIVGCFLFYFIGGYLLYSSLFAAIGSAVDNETDTQQFMLPITIPLIFSMGMLSVVMQDPDGQVALWMSMFPFTSPIIMMLRIPFGVPAYQLIISMVLLVGGFIFTTWVAARIYRIGILMTGKKINYKEIGKWFFIKI